MDSITLRMEKNDSIIFNGARICAVDAGTYEVAFDSITGAIVAALVKKIPVTTELEIIHVGDSSCLDHKGNLRRLA